MRLQVIIFDIGMILLFGILLDLCGVVILHLSRSWYVSGSWPSHRTLSRMHILGF